MQVMWSLSDSIDFSVNEGNCSSSGGGRASWELVPGGRNSQEYPQLLHGVQLHPKGPLKTAVYGTKFVRSTDQHLPDQTDRESCFLNGWLTESL